ncbi:MAG: hypothetical protein GWN58_53810 [Anaerolineae bacterium]|nr:hypothetical protein [Anaerolineae bacterium]
MADRSIPTARLRTISGPTKHKGKKIKIKGDAGASAKKKEKSKKRRRARISLGIPTGGRGKQQGGGRRIAIKRRIRQDDERTLKTRGGMAYAGRRMK